MAKQTPSRKPVAGKAVSPARKSAPSAKPKTGGTKPKGVAASKNATAAKPAAGAKSNSPVAGGMKAGKNTSAQERKGAVKPAQKRPPVRPTPSLAELDNQELEQTRLTPKELDEFREMLLVKRQQLIGDVTHLEDEAIRSRQLGSSGGSSMPIHMADLGSDTWEQELTLGLIENERGLLREIDEALERIKDGTYGICIATGKPITKARLRAKPWAKYCIEYARKRELGLV